MYYFRCVVPIPVDPGAPNSAKFRGGCRFDKGGVTNFLKIFTR